MEKAKHWYKQFTDKLELSGMSPRTQESYSRAVRLLMNYCNKEPEKITEKDVQILPSGFMKIRYYRFMHPSFSMDYDVLRL